MTSDTKPALQRNLKNRHLQLIALGGAIGTGLFLGIGGAMKLAGPAVILSYAIGGVIAFFIMRQLGEMMVEEPVAGSFSSLAYKYWGDFAGLFSGWNYWMLYLLVSMAELTAIGKYVNYWFPHVEQWQTVAFFFFLVSAINLGNVRFFGEMEFLFASIKVIAICSMIILGSVILMGGLAPETSSISNLWEHGGFMPTGWQTWILSVPIVMFSYGGLELVGIAAAETSNPQKSIPKAVNQLIYRILIFYIGAIVILLSLYPWDMLIATKADNWAAAMEASPFVLIFSKIGIPMAAHILNFVILTAALSVYNSSIYCNSRVLYGLALQHNAPQTFAQVNARGVPITALLATSGATLLCVILNYVLPERIMGIFMALVVASLVLNWAMISLTHIKFRRAVKKTSSQFIFPSIAYPVTNYICIAFMGATFVGLWLLGETMSVLLAPVWVLGFWLFYQLFLKQQRKNKKNAQQLL